MKIAGLLLGFAALGFIGYRFLRCENCSSNVNPILVQGEIAMACNDMHKDGITTQISILKDNQSEKIQGIAKDLETAINSDSCEQDLNRILESASKDLDEQERSQLAHAIKKAMGIAAAAPTKCIAIVILLSSFVMLIHVSLQLLLF